MIPEYFYKRAHWKRMRQLVLAREQYCAGCGQEEPDVRLEVHHRVYPWQLGRHAPYDGEDGERIEELAAFCTGCHLEITERRRALFGANLGPLGKPLPAHLDIPRSATAPERRSLASRRSGRG